MSNFPLAGSGVCSNEIVYVAGRLASTHLLQVSTVRPHLTSTAYFFSVLVISGEQLGSINLFHHAPPVNNTANVAPHC